MYGFTAKLSVAMFDYLPSLLLIRCITAFKEFFISKNEICTVSNKLEKIWNIITLNDEKLIYILTAPSFMSSFMHLDPQTFILCSESILHDSV